MSSYFRFSDGATVDQAEACDGRGVLRSGYGVKRRQIFTDSMGTTIPLAATSDRAATLTDAKAARDAAYAERNQRYATTHLGAALSAPAQATRHEPAHIVRDAKVAEAAELSRLRGALAATLALRDEHYRTAHLGDRHG